MPDRKIFAVNLLFRATVVITDTEVWSLPIHCLHAFLLHYLIRSLKSLHTLFDTHLDHVLAKFNQIVWSKMYKFWVSWQKTELFKSHFWQSVDAILQDVSVAETIVMGNLLIFRLLSFSVKNYGNATRVTRLKVAPKPDKYEHSFSWLRWRYF